MHRVVGDAHTEWWIPAEDLEELNDNIVGRIDVVASFSPNAKLPETGT